MLSIASTVITATIFHMIYREKGKIPKGTLPEILLAFSLISNWKKLCGPANEDGLKLECISGIKFISMGLIIAGHSLMYVIQGPILNKEFWNEVNTLF